MMQKSLCCTDVTVRHEPGKPPTLSKISFSLDPGEKIALLGLNGTGKTTLLSAIVGLIGFEGEVSICGEALNRKSAARLRRNVGFLFNVPEDQLLFPKVNEDVAFGLLQAGAAPNEAAVRVKAVLDRLGLRHLFDSPLHHLSHGQKQRVALAGAIVTNPPLLLLDEPSAGLDPPGKMALAEILLNLGSSQLIATHDLEFADRICTRVILLEQGTIADETMSIDAVRKRWGLLKVSRSASRDAEK
jgi:cobalt/nickel transport system ATP-binding protein